ncbi:MAG: homoserine dehydrogenase [Dehalococcoidia bacterium]|nr:homoserine dehydrogenase [Dehalococcoidia bacterium]
MAAKEIGIGLLGLGVVGSGVAESLLSNHANLARRVGAPVALRGAVVRDVKKHQTTRSWPFPLYTDASKVLNAPDVDIVIEVMGGEQPALSYMERALRAGKHVVTANKEVMAKHGPHLLALAREMDRTLSFEASVGGGIPIIGPLQRDLLANDLVSIRAIINGTTNYILSKMANEGMDYSVALKQAQQLGFAEADPTNDVEGIDASYKLAVLASLAFHTRVTATDVPHEGITKLRAKDFQYARELGYAIKLLAIATRENGSVCVRVHPTMLPQEMLLAKVDGAYNAIEVKGELTGTLTFHGLGAGSKPTASAVLGDVVNIARALAAGGRSPSLLTPEDSMSGQGATLRSMSELYLRYYLRLNVLDRAGVLAQIASVLGEGGISIASVIQKDTDAVAGTAELIFTTHPAQEARMRDALKRIAQLPVIKEVSNVVRMEPI